MFLKKNKVVFLKKNKVWQNLENIFKILKKHL